ncbi:MAG: transcription antitermination factor NusB [Bilophila sp.]
MKKRPVKKKTVEAPLSAREAALRILERTGIRAPVQSLLDTKLTGGAFSRQDAALTTELVYGYLRSELRLTWVLGRFLKTPEKLPPVMKLILGIAAYEMLYLDRVPYHASVNAAVEAASARFGKGLSGVANGVLRALARLLESVPKTEAQGSLPAEHPLSQAAYARIQDPLERLSLEYSVPRWMLALWIKAYGMDRAVALATAVSALPHPCVRVNTARDEWEALRTILCRDGSPFGVSGVRFAPGNQPEYLRDYLRQGRLSFHGAGSQLVLEALGASQWQGPVWDACAGRGGKTLMLMERGVAVQLASDTYQPRLRGLRDDAKRLVLTPPPIACASATAPALALDFVPRTIVLDVPCSGLGTLARHPDLRTLRTPEQLPELVALQQRILTAAWERLASGGHLAYITCTMNPEENEGQIAAFLAQTPTATLERQWESTPDAFGSDLMFGALLRKA